MGEVSNPEEVLGWETDFGQEHPIVDFLSEYGAWWRSEESKERWDDMYFPKLPFGRPDKVRS